MGFTYHKPTRTICPVCERLIEGETQAPIIDTWAGRASSANGYPFHDWYNFVLGYTPLFPEYILSREKIQDGDNKVILDPFGGSGTTQLVCKLKRLASIGIDANDFMVFAAKQKLNWNLSSAKIAEFRASIVCTFTELASGIDWGDKEKLHEFVNTDRPAALDERYISDKPLAKIKLLRNSILLLKLPEDYHNLFMFAVSAILVPVSNIKYGPGFGVGKVKDDVDVLSVFNSKVDTMITDLNSVTVDQRGTQSKTILGDSRKLTSYIPRESVDLMITSPPYPGDHEYTKHSKLELIFNGYATDMATFRVIKKRMVRGSTTNIYRDDNERASIEDIGEIREVTNEIATRLIHDGASSGFEKLYTKLVWEYFGGMANSLRECLQVLKPGGKIALLVSDSHAFKMVHIRTAELLAKVGERVGFANSTIVLWQMKNSTSHKYLLRENILFLEKAR